MIFYIEDDVGVQYQYEFDINKTLHICSVDIDGTLSSGVLYLDNGRIARQYHMQDGMGVSLLKNMPNVLVVFISGESDASIWNRAAKLEVPFFHSNNKAQTLNKILAIFNIIESRRIYHIGDDINDLTALRMSDIPSCPYEAHGKVIRYVEEKNGKIALDVREWADWLIGDILL